MASLTLDRVQFDYQGAPMIFDLAVHPGEILALIGPSGAGKTTLLNLIAGFLTPVSGHILVDGRDIGALAPADRPLTILFQDHSLFDHLTVLQNLTLGLRPSLRLSAAERVQLLAALARVGLSGLEDRLPTQLSGGQRQRVALARSLVRQRPILLLDEPFAALGPAMRRDMLALVDDLRRQTGMTVLLVNHQPEDVRGVADRCAFIHDGRIAAIDRTDALLSRTDLPALAEYLGQET